MDLKFLDFKELTDFPSASGIEFFDDKIYLVGDDATNILVMNKKWKELERIPLFESAEARIPKELKADLEATTIVEINKIPRLLLLGSGSLEPNRDKALVVNMDNITAEEFDIAPFYNRLRSNGINEVNIESAVIILGELLMGNRASKKLPENKIVLVSPEFWRHPEEVEFTTLAFELPKKTEPGLGLSGMNYAPLNDWLVFTMSTENTPNPVADGPIGDSYLGIVENASLKVGRKKIKVNYLVNLSEADERFRGYKIESVCVQSEKDDRAKLQLVADNDTGVSFLFKVRIAL